MKLFALTIILGLAAATAAPVVAGEVPTTKAKCEQVGMRWKEKTSKCKPLYEKHTLSFNVFGVIGLGCALAGFITVCREWRRSVNAPVSAIGVV